MTIYSKEIMRSFIQISITTLVLFAIGFVGCEKKQSNEYQFPHHIIEKNEEFEDEKDSLRKELSDKIEALELQAESIDIFVFDHSDRLSENLELKYLELEKDIIEYSEKLQEKITLIDWQQEVDWEKFKNQSRDRLLETKLEFRQMRLNLKETFQKP